MIVNCRGTGDSRHGTPMLAADMCGELFRAPCSKAELCSARQRVLAASTALYGFSARQQLYELFCRAFVIF